MRLAAERWWARSQFPRERLRGSPIPKETQSGCCRIKSRSGQCNSPWLFRPDRGCSPAQNLFLHLFANRQRFEVVQILLDVWDARAGPVRAELSLVCELLETREIFEQRFRWNAADVEINVGVPAKQKECGLHPKRTTAVRQQDFEVREIDCHIVKVDRIAILVAGSGKDRCSRMKHNRDAIRLRGAVYDFEFLHSVQIIVGK